MITLKALRLTAVVMAHGNPRCNVLLLPHGGNALVAYCWASRRDGTCELQVDWIDPTVPSVRDWLGY